MRMLALPRVSGFLIGLLAVLSGLSGCDATDPVSRGRINAFDTVMEVTLIGVDRQRAAKIIRVLEADLRLMEAAWQASEPGPVSHMNALFNEGAAPFAAPPSVLPLLRLSKTLSEQSEDLFNPAIGHLTRAWGFQGREPECLQPAPEEIIDLIVTARPSMRDITIDGLRVSSRKQTVKLDFSGIQKGFAIDQAIATTAGIRDSECKHRCRRRSARHRLTCRPPLERRHPRSRRWGRIGHPADLGQ